MKTSTGFKSGLALLIVAVVIGGFNNCARPKAAPGGSSDGSSFGTGAGLAAFKSGFYAYAKSQNCVMCHSNTSSLAHAPFFGSPDVNLAYSEAKGEIDFSNPTVSNLATYAGNGHCAAAPCSTPANTGTVKPLLQSWADAELAGNPSPPVSASVKYLTTSVAVPATIPTLMSSNTPAVVRFQLSALAPSVASLNQAILEIEIQKANATTYRINKIKIQGNTAAVSVTGVHVYVKPAGTSGVGIEDTNQGVNWVDMTATAPTSSLPNPLPTRPLTATPLFTNALGVQMQSPSDMITIGIEDIQ